MDRIVVVGAGAVGSFYGGRLARAGYPVTLIGREAHVRAIRSRGLRMQEDGRVSDVRVEAETTLEAARGARLVLLCVKSRDTAATARALRPLLAEDGLILSLQNGVANPGLIAAEWPGPVVPTVVYVATALAGAGEVIHHGGGSLMMGRWAERPADAGRLEAVADGFRDAGIPVTVSDRVMDAMWGKLMVNCAYNALSAISQLNYSTLTSNGALRELMVALVREVVAVGQAQGITFVDDVETALWSIAETMPQQRSSTAQDLARGRPTEIDWINGQIVRDGERLGISTPANQAVWALVRLFESSGQVAGPRLV